MRKHYSLGKTCRSGCVYYCGHVRRIYCCPGFHQIFPEPGSHFFPDGYDLCKMLCSRNRIKSIYIRDCRSLISNRLNFIIKGFVGYKYKFWFRMVQDKCILFTTDCRVYWNTNCTNLTYSKVGKIPLRSVIGDDGNLIPFFYSKREQGITYPVTKVNILRYGIHFPFTIFLARQYVSFISILSLHPVKQVKSYRYLHPYLYEFEK